jgi:hypothetical protein
MYWLIIDNKRTGIHTRLSHGEREADDWIQRQIAKQMKLSPSEFTEFVKCTIDGTRYAELVGQRVPSP